MPRGRKVERDVIWRRPLSGDQSSLVPTWSENGVSWRRWLPSTRDTNSAEPVREKQVKASIVPQQMHTYALGETYAMFLNTRLAPFNRIAARRALDLAADRSR